MKIFAFALIAGIFSPSNSLQLFKLPNAFTYKKANVKAQLLESLAGADLGRNTSVEDAVEISELFSKVEKTNPTKNPLGSKLLDGRWRLIYTTSRSIIGLDKPTFLRSKGPVYQYINTTDLTARNEEFIYPLPSIKVTSAVDSTLTPKSKSLVDVKFEEFQIGPIRFKAPDSARGSLDITYLDEDLRLSRGDKGNLFVLVKD
mmetsp:Transcript_10185/g.14413  ORF Transcript_10185/g.14413 Transcript_10185/m.14413 type:complete len:202 (+) Transcript_10185:7-612(+)|eukprot:CAMPEP_0171461668 /NCGR_PEP_ID=MMETSP0945-20130129/6021_1 /TAXON_ID=109269 /ORGANISM="Vaucheria litorea, Strain CCMP2940" /LENGTH=201 /DNA_ID=CAMNT_0011988055 /DNA_START=6 /DNA_END=611 /DNA_ORIENTATION=-